MNNSVLIWCKTVKHYQERRKVTDDIFSSDHSRVNWTKNDESKMSFRVLDKLSERHSSLKRSRPFILQIFITLCAKRQVMKRIQLSLIFIHKLFRGMELSVRIFTCLLSCSSRRRQMISSLTTDMKKYFVCTWPRVSLHSFSNDSMWD